MDYFPVKNIEKEDQSVSTFYPISIRKMINDYPVASPDPDIPDPAF